MNSSGFTSKPQPAPSTNLLQLQPHGSQASPRLAGVEGSYSVPSLDMRIARAAIPRPDDFPSTVNRCVTCPSGRWCSQGVGCPYRALDETRLTRLTGAEFECPPRCPVGHRCPEASAKPTPCNQGQYQDERGQTACKECVYCNGSVAGVRTSEARRPARSASLMRLCVSPPRMSRRLHALRPLRKPPP